MSDPRNISPAPSVQGVRVTVLAVRRVAAMAERALRDAGYTEADDVMQDLLAAKLVAEDALAMEQAGDDLAEPLAREALRMAKDALRAGQKPVALPVDTAGDLSTPAPGGAYAQDDKVQAAPVVPDPAPAESAPVVILSEANAVSAVEGSPAAPAITPTTAPPAAPAVAPAVVPVVPDPAPAESAPVVILSEANAVSAVEGSPAAPAITPTTAPFPIQPAAVAQDLSTPAPGGAYAQDDKVQAPPAAPAVAPTTAPPAPLPHPTRIDLPEVFTPPTPAPAPAPAPTPQPAPQPAPVPAPQPVPHLEPTPAPEPPRTRRDREFTIPYGPVTAAPAESGIFAPEEPASTPGKHAAPAAAPRKPKAAKRVCAALAIVLVAMAGAVGAAWWGFINLPEPVQSRIELLPDAHAAQGRLNASDADVAPGSYQLVLNQVATMDAGSRTLPIAFENPAANTHASRLELSLDGERVASTGMVNPGYYVEDVNLARMLPQGEHELAATVHVYSGATQINTLSANVTVRVR